MKNGKKPTVKQMKLIKSSGLNTDNWLVTKNLSDALHIVHRVSGNERVINY
ncbi:DUF6906 family protein [Tepidibacillus marianensis]|uniref:DUF6906 family protein n=1 Tax=Tepidibacillus marianensis TaxID=3131995 RepID=UPI0030D051DA